MQVKYGLIVMAVLALAFAGPAAADMHGAKKGPNVHKATGEVLMMTTEMMHVATAEDDIEEFAITEDSDVDERVNKGDRVEVWYREAGEAGQESKVVMRSSASMEMEMENEKAKTKGAPELDMIAGEVVDEKPTLIHLATRTGEIVELEVGDNSDLDERVNEGDYVKIWYRENEAGSKAVVRSSRSMRVDSY